MQTNPPHFSILVFDSGIGGLSIAREIRKSIPGIQIDYLADIEAHPYGPKTDKEISLRVRKVISSAIDTIKPDLVVIACNTASTVVLDGLRSTHAIPFVGVVPAIKPAAEISKSGHIGVLGTAGTVSRSYTKDLIKQFAAHKTVHLYGSSRLVGEAEAKLRGEGVNASVVLSEVNGLIKLSGKIDTIVLACTHFPILSIELSKALPKIGYWIDSGLAVAKRTLHCLENIGYTNTGNTNTTLMNRFICTLDGNRYDCDQIKNYLGEYDEEFINIDT